MCLSLQCLHEQSRTDVCGAGWQVHIRKGRPLERILFQAAEVVVTAAAVCMITLASNHIRHRGSNKQLADEKLQELPKKRTDTD